MPGLVRLYLDEDSGSLRAVRALRANAIDVLTAVEAERQRVPDAEQLAFAASTGRVIVTANQGDYARLHHEWMASGCGHAGIVIRTWQGMSPEDQAALLVDLVMNTTADEMVDTLVFLKRRQS